MSKKFKILLLKFVGFILSYDSKHFSNVWGQVYTNLEGNKSHLVHTRWAMLALIRAGQVGQVCVESFIFKIIKID